ncbi:uncharacterized protein BT62DRAFT_463827 [Guyanagaster necrorhizus]|uniref:Uncharacterized protein n=1 Tax=Guyanagaster necrorhizus TaxID=856835 RepID=A0A9P7VJN2_9AGAR|nr:uncharacterized protein BT62DRAFT_463827 [Guyanagaster necrorhizus MCA 3950]KAG7441788.1 hypothetical protein BT62DRAFT_463827 [Guyanagaster necrorhizus MCA 3950]
MITKKHGIIVVHVNEAIRNCPNFISLRVFPSDRRRFTTGAVFHSISCDILHAGDASRSLSQIYVNTLDSMPMSVFPPDRLSVKGYIFISYLIPGRLLYVYARPWRLLPSNSHHVFLQLYRCHLDGSAAVKAFAFRALELPSTYRYRGTSAKAVVTRGLLISLFFPSTNICSLDCPHYQRL